MKLNILGLGLTSLIAFCEGSLQNNKNNNNNNNNNYNKYI